MCFWWRKSAYSNVCSWKSSGILFALANDCRRNYCTSLSIRIPCWTALLIPKHSFKATTWGGGKVGGREISVTPFDVHLCVLFWEILILPLMFYAGFLASYCFHGSSFIMLIISLPFSLTSFLHVIKNGFTEQCFYNIGFVELL